MIIRPYEECDHDMNIMMISSYFLISMVIRISSYFMIIANLTFTIAIIITIITAYHRWLLGRASQLVVGL
jgi:hypothetical protein